MPYRVLSIPRHILGAWMRRSQSTDGGTRAASLRPTRSQSAPAARPRANPFSALPRAIPPQHAHAVGARSRIQTSRWFCCLSASAVKATWCEPLHEHALVARADYTIISSPLSWISLHHGDGPVESEPPPGGSVSLSAGSLRHSHDRLHRRMVPSASHPRPCTCTTSSGSVNHLQTLENKTMKSSLFIFFHSFKLPDFLKFIVTWISVLSIKFFYILDSCVSNKSISQNPFWSRGRLIRTDPSRVQPARVSSTDVNPKLH